VTLITIETVHDLGNWAEDMAAEAASEGFRFVDRLTREWRTGENTFSGPGERLVLARVAGMAAGVCGCNSDASAPGDRTGRLRHLYVRPQLRRLGVGRALVGDLLVAARPSSLRVRLRTDTPEADQFYRALGFVPCAQSNATHIYEFPR
jgi:GNAT superfamily N-acetyltransferase